MVSAKQSQSLPDALSPDPLGHVWGYEVGTRTGIIASSPCLIQPTQLHLCTHTTLRSRSLKNLTMTQEMGCSSPADPYQCTENKAYNLCVRGYVC